MTDLIHAIIIEDEHRAQIYLKGILELHFPYVKVVDVCDDLPSGVVSIRKNRPNLVFLDIEMPKYSGLDICHFFNDNELNFGIIFTTAYNQYAIEAFKTLAIDYLLKPIEVEDIESALRNYKLRFSNMSEKINSLNDKLNKIDKIAVPDGNSLIMIDPEDIVYLKADNSYTNIILKTGKKYITSRFLKNFEDSLSNHNQFIRCHKSYIINSNFISSYSKSDGGTITLENGSEIPVSPEKINLILEKFIRVNR